jgi:hypothetical protein
MYSDMFYIDWYLDLWNRNKFNSIQFSEEGSIVQYSFRVWGMHRTSQVHYKTCLNETYSKVHIGKHLSDSFPIKNGLKQGDALSPLLFNFALEYDIRKSRKTGLD